MTAEATDLPELAGAMKIVSRAEGLDDRRNALRAYVGTGKSGVVEWLFYLSDKQFTELGEPTYFTILAEPGAHIGIDLV